jgi:hypothetical protein
MCDHSRMPILPRLFAGLPDALTCALFLLAWIAPGFVGATRVKDLMLTMLIEFIVMHSSAFYAGVAGMTAPRATRLAAITGLSAFYLVFVLGFSYGFHSTWPIFAFGWLFVSRFLHLWTNNAGSDDRAQGMMSAWAVSAIAYIGGVFATIILPLPALGLTPAAIAALQIPHGMSGLWIDKPWTVMAFGALYFGVLAWTKFAGALMPVAAPRFGRGDS